MKLRSPIAKGRRGDRSEPFADHVCFGWYTQLVKMRLGPMVDQLDRAIKGRRSMEEALADLRAKYEQQPSFELARMIQQLLAEIAIRKYRPKR